VRFPWTWISRRRWLTQGDLECRDLIATGRFSRAASPAICRADRLFAPQLDHEDHTKDIDFSQAGIRQRREAGYACTKAVLARKPWMGQFDPLSGVILHEPRHFAALAAE
jgi:Patatin phospholipase